MRCISETQIREYCLDLTEKLTYEYENAANKPFVLRTVREFREQLKQINIKSKTVFNKRFYDWYYGNLCHHIIHLVYYPECGMSPITFMSKEQACDALFCCYELFLNDECSSTLKDYYGESGKHILAQRLHVSDVSQTLPIYLKELIPTFIYLFSKGTDIKSIQGRYIYNYLQRKREFAKLKWAVGIIESRFLEVALSPYTKIGKRLLQKRSNLFYKRALDLCSVRSV